MPRIKDQAICIRLIDWSETSQIVAMLTQEHGKVRGVAKGSKRMSPGSIARFSGGVELLTMGQVVANIKPSSDLANLTEWDLQEPWWHLRKDLEAQRLGLFAADLVNAMLADHDPHPATFAAMATFLESLRSPADRGAILLRFQWSVLSDCGYRPELQLDIHGGGDLADHGSYTFDPRAGGFTAGDAPDGGWKVRRQTLQTLRELEGAGSGSDDAVLRANRFLCTYARFLLDRQLPTMRFILDEGRAAGVGYGRDGAGPAG
jgi:DNA repair protein RecO (recombination protein O)